MKHQRTVAPRRWKAIKDPWLRQIPALFVAEMLTRPERRKSYRWTLYRQFFSWLC